MVGHGKEGKRNEMSEKKNYRIKVKEEKRKESKEGRTGEEYNGDGGEK